MNIKELANYCKSIEIDCRKCEHKEKCREMQEHLEDLSPFGVVKMVESNMDFTGN